MLEDKYDKVSLKNIDPNILVADILDEMDLLLTHLDILGAVTYHEDLPWVLQQTFLRIEACYDILMRLPDLENKEED